MKANVIQLLAFVLLSIPGLSQVPEAFKYQAALYDNNGTPLANRNIQFRIEIRSFSPEGPKRYSEFQEVLTSESGVVSLQIGEGNPLFGNFSEIDWSSDKHFLKIDFDETGGVNFKTLSNSQLMSVPYALVAKTVENVDDADADASNEIQQLTIEGDVLQLSKDANKVDLKNYLDNTDEQTLRLAGNVLSISNGNSVDLGDFSDLDSDPKNELQDLALSGNVLTLTGSTSLVDLSSILVDESTKYYSIDPADFMLVPGRANVGGLRLQYPDARYLMGKPNMQVVMAPIHLPQGASLKRITVNFLDANAASPDIEVELLASPLDGMSDNTILATLNSSGVSADAQRIADVDTVIDNSKFIYRLKVIIPKNVAGNDYRFYSALLNYTK